MTTNRFPPVFLTVALVLSALLTACSSPKLEADVTRFHVMPVPDGQLVHVIPAEEVAEDPAFPSYAEQLGARLGPLGFRPAGGEEPEIHAILSYSLSSQSGGEAADTNTSVGVGIGTGGRRSGVGLGFGVDLSDRDRRRTLYNRRISLILLDLESGERLWEGRAISTGRTPGLETVMGPMLDALLSDFPGASGATISVTVPQP